MGAMWVSLRSARVHLDLAPQSGAASLDLVLDVLFEFARKETKLGAGRPGRVEVSADLRDALETALAGTGTQAGAVDCLDRLADALRSFEAAQTGGEGPAGLLESPGITIERLRAFATAAERFYTARPWRHLVNEDLIAVESPNPPRAWPACQCSETAGRSSASRFTSPEGLRPALAPPSSERDVARVRRDVRFDPTSCRSPTSMRGRTTRSPWPARGRIRFPPTSIATASLDGPPPRPSGTWRQCCARWPSLPKTTSIRAGGGVTSRPSTGLWKWCSTLLPDLLEAERKPARPKRPAISPRTAERAIARVQRARAERGFESLDEANAALEEMSQQGLFGGYTLPAAAPALSALEQAQELVYDAEEARGRQRILLAKRAIARSPDCADAYRLLGKLAATAEEAIEWFQKGVDAGRRAVGVEFDSLAGMFWDVETRPYPTVLSALAQSLLELGQAPEAIAHLEELLRLNPGDNQGVRDTLWPRSAYEMRHEDTGELLDEYADDASAMWLYGRALWLFFRSGDSAPRPGRVARGAAR